MSGSSPGCSRNASLRACVFRCFVSGAFAALAMFATSILEAQTYPLPIPDSAIANPYVLHARDWPPLLGLPNSVFMRTNAGERWYQIERARGEFSPTFGNLFLPDTGWVAMAEKYHTSLIYTFNTVPAWAVHGQGAGPAKTAPYDIDQRDEACAAPLAGYTSPTGDCIWKEFVTALLQRNCEVASQPQHPLVGKCHIRYFETWNEFNADLFWGDSLTHLAKMANDMAVVVRLYCGDCYIVAGSASAGGVGRAGGGSGGSGSFAVALGEFLDAWHNLPDPSLPDVVSFHAYPSRTNVSFPPFPETNVSVNDPKCTAALVPNPSCEYSVFEQPIALRKVLEKRSYLKAGIPIWNTESGWNGNHTLQHGLGPDGRADAQTEVLRQAYLARQTILLANRGVPVNLWYEADHQCTGTLFGFGQSASGPDMISCSKDPVVPEGLTAAGRALVVLRGWLHDAEFTGPCQSAKTVWWCPVSGPATGDGILAWSTSWSGPESAAVLPAAYQFAHTLDGTTASLKPGEKPLLEARPRLFNSKR